MTSIQPIDFAYFKTGFFLLTTVGSFILVSLGVYRASRR